MARPRHWATQIGNIRTTLETWESGPLGIGQVQDLFVIGRSSAYHIMQQAGGIAGFVGADDLLRWLEESEEGQEAQFRQNVIAARQPKAYVSPFVRWTRLRDLEDKVRFEDGELRVKFSSLEELVGTLFRLAKAMIHDWPEFQKQCERKPSL